MEEGPLILTSVLYKYKWLSTPRGVPRCPNLGIRNGGENVLAIPMQKMTINLRADSMKSVNRSFFLVETDFLEHFAFMARLIN